MSLIQEALKRQQEEAGKSKPAETSSQAPAVSPIAPKPPAAPAVSHISAKPSMIQMPSPEVPPAPPIPDAVMPPPPPPPPVTQPLGLKKNVPAPAAAQEADGVNQPPPIPLEKISDGGKKKKIIIIAAALLLLAAAGGGAAFFFMSGGKPPAPAPEANPAEQPAAPVVTEQPAVQPVETTPAEQPAAANTNVQPVTGTAPAVAAPAPVEKQPVLWPSLSVSGIVGKGSKGTVIINNEILSVGEEIQEVVVKEIKPNGAVLEYKGETKFIKVGGSSE